MTKPTDAYFAVSFRSELEAEQFSLQALNACAEVVWWRCHRRIITDYLLRRASQSCTSWDSTISIPHDSRRVRNGSPMVRFDMLWFSHQIISKTT